MQVLVYETRCRRCDTFTQWLFADAKSFDLMEFYVVMQDRVEHPRLMHCKECQRQTIQDVTYYGKTEDCVIDGCRSDNRGNLKFCYICKYKWGCLSNL